MKRTAQIITLLTILILVSAGIAGAGIPAAERQALIDLYNSTDGANWTNKTGWLGEAGTECSWYGVTCDTGENYVTIVNLPNNKLTGTLPASIGNFANLSTLHLYYNQLNGSIPSEIGNLVKLTRLALYNNQLSGSIPIEIGNLTNLTSLVLNNNQLSGNIPPEIGDLANLGSLSLSYNQLSGSIPTKIGNLANLTQLFLLSNQLSGNIPPEIGNLTNLTQVILSSNQLSGNIPSEIENLVKLTQLYLDLNQLSGSIPPEIGNLAANLTRLGLSGNQLSGNIPTELGTLTKLTQLYLNDNQLSGNIPPEIGSLANLTTLYLNNNQLSGSIPAEIGNLIKLTTLSLYSNQLSGSIPTEIGNLVSLSNFGLSYNALYAEDTSLRTFLNSKSTDWEITQTVAPVNLSAATPAETSVSLTWTPITYVSTAGGYEVYFATTSGGPYTLFETTADKSATGITVTGLSPNTTYYFRVRTKTDPHTGNTNTVYSEYTAEISATTAAAATVGIPAAERQALIDLYNSTDGANWTNKTGWLGETGTECSWYGVTCNAEDSGVTKITLSSNNLAGTIPVSLGSLTNLTVLGLSVNALTGEIPPELGSLTNLAEMIISANQLSGSIPPELGSLTKLTVLQINDNQLTGEIPPELGSLTKLTRLFLHKNQLTGNVPAELGSLSGLTQLYLNANQLSGSIPSELANLTNLTELHLEYNAFHTYNDTLRTFLNSKQEGGNWESSQTVAPVNLAAATPGETGIPLTWTPIAYTGATGGYEVSFATTSGGPYTLFGTTANKSATGITVTGLSPDTTYYFRVRTKTDPHTSNTNTVYSEYTAEVSATTKAAKLIAHWKFDEADGNTAIDSTGNGHNGAITNFSGNTWQRTEGISGGGLDLTDGQNYVAVPDDGSLSLTGQMTLSCWVKLNEIDARMVLKIADTNQNKLNYELGSREDGFIFHTENSADDQDKYVYSTTKQQLGIWYHVTGVYDGEKVCIYVNGVLENSKDTGSFVPYTGSADLTLGTNHFTDRGTGESWANAVVDDIRIYNYALSAEDIQGLYNENIPDVSRGLLAHYEFEGNANDSSGNGNNGTENGGVSYESGVIGQSASFDGTDDKIQLPGNVMSGATVTANLWIKTDDDTFGLISGANTNRDNEYVVHVQGENSNTLRAYYNEYMYVTNVTANDGQWHMLTVITETDKTTFYLDGVFAETSGGYGAGTDGKLYIEGLWLGAEQDCLNGCWDSDQHFSGLMDDVRIYNRAVSKSEIQELYTMRPDTNRGLVAHYEFEGNADDSSGNGNNGTENGGLTYGTGVSGQAASFDGVDDYIEIYSSGELVAQDSIAVSAWIKPDKILEGIKQFNIFTQNDTTSGYVTHDVKMRDGKFAYDNWLPGLNNLYSATDMQAGTWQHVVASRENGIVSIWINGELDATGTAEARESAEYVDNTLIGARYYSGSPHHVFDGLIDDLRIYNRSLSEAEIQELSEQLPDTSRGLVAHYEFEGNANDSSGNGNNGTENGGVSYESGVIGQSASFDGTDDYIQVSNNSTLELNRHLTISYFMAPQPDPAGNFLPVVCKNSHIGNNYSSWIRPDSAGLSFQQYPQGSTDGVEYTFRSETPVEAGKWIHVAMLRDDTAVKIYLDGVLVAEGAADYEANEKGESLFIGYDGGFGYPNFKGLLDDLRIYNRALSQAEIQTLSEQLPDTSRGLVAHYEFEGNANDSSGNGNNGTENGGLTYGTGVSGQAVNLDGADDFINLLSVDDELKGLSSLTVSAWVKNANAGTNDDTFIVQHMTARGLRIGIDAGGNTRIGVKTTATGNSWGYTVTNASSVASTSEWNHMLLLWDGSDLKTYVNGTEIRSIGVSGSFSSEVLIENTNCYIGYNTFSSKYFKGMVDDLRIYNYGLSEAEIQELYNENAPDISRGLVAYYPFNGNANDESGNAYHGAVQNSVALTTDRFGSADSAYHFDGVDDWINVPGVNFDFTETEFTFSVWFKVDELKSLQNIFWVQDGQPSIHLRDKSVVFSHKAATDYPPATAEESIDDNLALIRENDWNFATYTYTSSDNTLRFYLNGSQVGWRRLESNFIKTSGGRFRIGVDDGTDERARWFSGSIDELRVYDRVLSNVEIEELNSQRPDVNRGLVAYYPFNGNANDESGNGNHATAYGGISYDESGVIGHAANFDGTDDRIQLLDNVNPITANLWIKTNDDTFALISGVNGSIRIYYYYGNIRHQTTVHVTDVIVNNGQWHMLTIINGITIYLDGVLTEISDDPTSDGIRDIDGSWLGAEQYFERECCVQYFSGLMDEVRFYNRAISEAEIQELYSQRQSAGNNVYVDAAFTGTETGAETAPYNTIAEAVANAAPNSTLRIAKGIYAESLSVTNISGLKLAGGYTAATWTKDDSDQSFTQIIASGSVPGIRISNASNISVEGFILNTGLEAQNADNLQVKNCVLIGTAALQIQDSSNVSVSGCELTGISDTADSGVGIAALNSSLNISGNFIHADTTGIYLNASDGTIAGNSIHIRNTENPAAAIKLESLTGDVRVENNVLYFEGNALTGILETGSAATPVALLKNHFYADSSLIFYHDENGAGNITNLADLNNSTLSDVSEKGDNAYHPIPSYVPCFETGDTPCMNITYIPLPPFPDTDSDGLPDEWENLYFGNLSALSAADPDNDGLNNQGEYENGTDPNIADSDQDGTNDGAEVSDPNRHPLMADAPGPDIYVDSNLSGVEGGVGSGTAAQPYNRISDAVSNAQPNSTLYIAKGEYAESLTLTNISGLKIKGGWNNDSGTWTRDTDIDPGLTRIISGASPAILLSNSRQTFIEGMVIQNGVLAQNSEGLHLSRCVVIGDSSVRIEGGKVAISYCEIIGTSQNGNSGFGVALSNASAIIDSNFIHADTTAVLFNAGSSGTVINNSLHLRNLSNPAYGIRLASALGGNVHIENNVLYLEGGIMTGIYENSTAATPSVLLKNYFYGDASMIFYHDADAAGDITSLADLNNGTLSDISLRGQNVWHEIAPYQACISTEAAPCMDVTHIPYPPGADLDGDTLPDEWEDYYFGNTAQGSGSDPDEDDLSNAEEYAAGTDPANPDSDGDRLSDSAEVADSSRSPLIYERTQGPVIYVDAAYIGTELGTSSQPFNTISQALEVADNGASIYIAKGSYIESPDISNLYDLEIEGGWNNNSGLWTRDENLEPTATEIIAAAPAVHLSNAPHTFIEGLFIQNGLSAENSDSLHLSRSLLIGPVAVRISDGSAVLTYNEILGVSENADSGYGVILSNSAVIIDSNFIHADTAAIVFNSGSSGLVMNNSIHLRNLVNAGAGIRIESPPLSNVHIENNVLYLEGANMTGIYEIGDIADNVILLRNQFYGDENLIFCHEINGNITDIRTLGKGNVYHNIPPYTPCFETEGLPCMNLTHIPRPPGADLDGDMLPDEWEKIYFDDTGKYSAGDDPDNDDLSNIEEYINGTDPTNPDSDGDGMNDAEEIAKKRNPLVSDLIKGGGIFIKAADVLSSEVSDDVVQVRWQIAETSDFSSPVLDVKTKEQLTSLTVPDMILKPDTVYYVRIQTYDNADNESEWIGSLTFKTPPAADDTNCNGIPDILEIDDKTSDWDHNDVPDVNQTDMKCVQSFGGDIAICLKSGKNTASVDSLTFADPDMISETENRPDEMPLGLISFRITTENPGDVAEVTVYFSEPVPADKAGWYKYDTISGWQNYSPHFHFSDDRKSAVLKLKDGGFGDADGVANGVIADPSGPATDGEIFKSGVFTVGDSGIVGMDWLYDGGMYKGILGIFSLRDMESLVSDSAAFTAEAVRRMLSNTKDGYIVFIDEEEGARFSGLLGETKNWNTGVYKGLKRFQMRPGDRFATVLIPDSTLSELRGGSFSKQPLFSLAFSNPDHGLYLGQIADVNGMGNAFIYEDMGITVSDKDYNDLIFQITGVTAEAPALDDLVADKANWVDWRVSEELGKEIVEHIEMPAVQEDTLRLSVTLTSAAPVHLFVYNLDEEECGREGGYIAGASFEIGENSQQIFLPVSVSGEENYRVVLRGVENGSCTLSIKAHQGETAVLSEEIRQVDIKAHQSLSTDVSVSVKDSGLSIEAGTPELPTGADGNPLYYDFDGNGKIDDKDIDKVSSRWPSKIGEDAYDPFYDLDNDGVIGILDVTGVAYNNPRSTF